MAKLSFYFLLLSICIACNETSIKKIKEQKINSAVTDTKGDLMSDIPQENIISPILNKEINSITRDELVAYAKTLLGIPYLYASVDPAKGFDCSGFITYVFNHFQIAVPRSSIDFTNVGKTVDVESAKKGDLILFTGTVDSVIIVGHMGIITENIDTLKFIHSTSGKAYGVTVSAFTEHYKKRFVKVTRIFAD